MNFIAEGHESPDAEEFVALRLSALSLIDALLGGGEAEALQRGDPAVITTFASIDAHDLFWLYFATAQMLADVLKATPDPGELIRQMREITLRQGVEDVG